MHDSYTRAAVGVRAWGDVRSTPILDAALTLAGWAAFAASNWWWLGPLVYE